MGDGGGCHPRDNIALSWLSQKVDLSYDWYENLMISREKHTEWLAELTIQKSIEKQMEIFILGKSFKKETNLTNGSPAYLLKNLIEEKNQKQKFMIHSLIIKWKNLTTRVSFLLPLITRSLKT